MIDRAAVSPGSCSNNTLVISRFRLHTSIVLSPQTSYEKRKSEFLSVSSNMGVGSRARSVFRRIGQGAKSTTNHIKEHLSRSGHCLNKRKPLEEAELALLKQNVYSPFEKMAVPVGSGRFINTIAMSNGWNREEVDVDGVSTIVLAHGFGAGVGFWCNNLDHLATLSHPEKGPLRVLAFDWHGMGLSSRTPFVKRSEKTIDSALSQAEDYFVESMEAWRKELNIPKFALLGHSLGGYLSSLYASRYPLRVSKLLLASPVGIPAIPEEEVAASLKLGSHITFCSRLIKSAWSHNMTPQRLIRASGPLGKTIVKQIIGARFAILPKAKRDLIASYFYNISCGQGSGEFALNALLYPLMKGPHQGVFARKPIQTALLESVHPITLMFGGDEDWALHPLIQSSPLVDHANIRFEIIDSAGHHLYMDNAEAFHHIIQTSLQLEIL